MARLPKLKNCAIQFPRTMIKEMKGHDYYFPPIAGRSDGLGSGLSGFTRHCVEFTLSQPNLFAVYMEERIKSVKDSRREALLEQKRKVEEQLQELDD